MNSHFSPNPPQSHVPQHRQTSQNIPRSSFHNVQPTQNNTSKKDPQVWTESQDIALMSSWCLVSENLIVGKNQTGPTLWERVLEMYEQARAENPETMGEERSVESLRNRYKRLNTNVTKWVGAMKEANGRTRSGMSQRDIEKQANVIYGKHKFKDHEVFERVMSHHPKWELKTHDDRTRSRPDDEDNVEEGRGSSKRLRTNEDGEDPTESTPETPVSDVSTIRGPPGREKAKAKKKAKGAASQSSIVSDDFTNEIRQMRITREKELVAMTQLGQMRMKGAVLNTLIGKNHLSPDEEALKCRLMAELFP